MILGFGATEKETAMKIIKECAAAVKENGKDGVATVEKKYRDAEAVHSSMPREDAPERYSHFWSNFHEIYDGKVIVEFTIHHINRRHALSPDGWALLVTRWILRVDSDGDAIFSET